MTQARAQTTLSLAEAISKAETQSLETQQAQISHERAALEIEEANKFNDPDVSLGAHMATRWQAARDATAANSQIITRDAGISSQLNYTLYDFERKSATISRAEHIQQLAKAEDEEVREQVFWSVVRAYYTASSAMRLRKITKSQMEIYKSRLEQQKRNYTLGLRSESDVLMAEVDFGKSQINHQQSILESDAANLRLDILINLSTQFNDPNRVYFEILTNGVSTKHPDEWDVIIKKIANMKPTAREARIDKEIASLASDRELLYANTQPTLSAIISAEYGSTRNKDIRPLSLSANGQLAITWKIPWNGMLRIETERIALKQRDLDLQSAKIRKSRIQKAQEAVKTIQSGKIHFQLLEKQNLLAKKQRTLINTRYIAGKASALELSAAESALLSVFLDQTKLANIIAEALIDLAQAHGVRDIELLSRI